MIIILRFKKVIKFNKEFKTIPLLIRARVLCKVHLFAGLLVYSVLFVQLLTSFIFYIVNMATVFCQNIFVLEQMTILLLAIILETHLLQ